MQSLRELRILGEALAIIIVTWLLLGWYLVDRAITQADGSVLVMPLVHSALEAGPDWTQHLYRVGVIGGSKMHEFAGTMPIVQLCSILGLSTTAAVNVITIFVQLSFAFFGVIALQALVRVWAPDRKLAAPERVIAVWSFAFMPLFAWRYAYGHENLLLGLLPLWVTVSLLLSARAGTLGVTSLVLAVFAVANGISGLGAQTVAYSIVFGAPLLVLLLLDAPAGSRWGRAQWLVTAALTCTALLMLPRLLPMFAHAVSDDASRSLGESVKESFGTTAWRDWLGSLAWTHRIVAQWQEPGFLHEHNFALGPLLVFLPLACARSRRLVAGVLLGLVLAILFAQGVEPVSSLLAPLDAFRVPARAIFPAAMFIPLLALAAWFARTPAPANLRVHILVLLVFGATLPQIRHAPAALIESLAWVSGIGLVAVVRTRPTLTTRAAPALIVVAVVGVVSFDARFPRSAKWDTVENGPHELHDAVISQAPELADPLNRVDVRDAAAPFDMSMAFAAQLGSLDGVWYPPKRFIDLLSVLSGTPLPSTACVFELGRSRAFPVVQQLYNVRYQISVADRTFRELPAPIGPAWFPESLVTIGNAGEFATALGMGGDIRPRLKATAWVLASDRTPRSVSSACATARVRRAMSDGQMITIDIDAPAECVLVVATNYVSTFRATSTVVGVERESAVFPADIALTGISVPAGASRVTLRPVVTIPWWSRVAQLVGVLGFVTALAAHRRSSASRS